MNNWSTILNNAKTAADIIAILRNVLAQLDSKSFTQIEELFKQTDLTAQQKMSALDQLLADARADVLSQGFTARVYNTAQEGVDPVSGVPVGAFYNARSTNPAVYADEYKNNNGTPLATGKTYPTLKAWEDALAAVNAAGEARKAELSEIAAAVSGLNAGQEFFQTETELKATTPSVTGKVAKALDTKKVWYWNGSAWVDTGLSELDLAKEDATTKINAEFAKVTTTDVGKNLYNPAAKQIDKYILSTSTAGWLRTASGWGVTGFIAVLEGQYYTIKANALKRGGTAFYTDNTGSDASYIAGSYVAGDLAANTARTVQAPAGAKYMVVSLYSDTIPEPSQVMINEGQTALPYEAYAEPVTLIKPEVLPSTVVQQSQIPALVAKPYEKQMTYKNLFNKDTVKDGQYLNSTDGGIQFAAGWGTSAEIPVTAGQQYTISGTRGRAGVAFFTDATTTAAIAGSYNGATTNPLTVTAPAGANFMRINLYSSTATTYSNVQVEAGSSATTYEPNSGDKTFVNMSDIYPPIDTSSSFANATLSITSATTASITAKLSTTNTLRMNLITNKTVTHDQANRFNFDADYINDSLVRQLGDDIAPYRVFGVTIGANHGYSKTKITLDNHGKTDSDVGSVWSDGTKQWVIVDIVSSSQLNITARADNTTFSSGTLTHVSGASNTGSMTPTAAASSQWYPVSKNRNLTCNVDGVSVDLATVASYSYKSHATFSESYDIMSKTDIVEWIILNKGAALLYYYADASISVSMSYRFDTRGGCTISTDFAALKAISAFQDIMFTQSVKMNTTGGAVNFYIPKTLPFVHESVNYDFSAPTSLDSTTLATRINFTSDRCVATGQLADRVIQLNNTIGYATGYLPVLDTAPGVRRTNASNKALQISEAKKTYMSCIDGLKTSLSAGDYFRTVCYRNYFELSSARTATYIVESGQGDYLYADYHAAHANTLDRIVLPPKFHGKTVSVDEKSSNVSLLSGGTSAIVTSSVALKVGAYQSSTYAVLQIK